MNIFPFNRLTQAAAGMLVLLFCGVSGQLYAKDKTTEVIAYQVVPTLEAKTLNALGTLEAKQSINLAANVTEMIQAIHYRSGQMVHKGDLLVELDAREELAGLEEAKALAAEAERQYRRVKDIENKGSVTQSMIDEKFREWQTASAKIKVIQARINDRRILAPFDGQLGLNFSSVGALVTPANTIVALDDTSEMRLDMFIASQYLGALKPGQIVNLSVPAYPKQTFQGKIVAISPRLEQTVRMIKVRALIPNPQALLKTNMMVEAQMVLPAETQLKVPNTALIMLGDHAFVYRLNPTAEANLYQAEKVPVTLGEIGESQTNILTGLNANDLVVSQGVMRVKPKASIKIKALENNQSQDALLQPKKQAKDSEKTTRPGQNLTPKTQGNE